MTMDISGILAELHAAGRILPELSFKVALVLGAAGLLALALRRRSAAARHLVWTTAVAGVLALPLVQLLPVRLDLLPAWLSGAPETAPAPDAAPTFLSEEHAPAARRLTPQPPLPSPGSDALPQGAPGWRLADLRWQPLLGATWLLGTLVLVLRLLLGRATLWRMACTGERIVDEDWTVAADRISRRFGGRRARLIRSRRTEMPMTWGVIRPVVLLPASCEGWSDERREMVLRHELAHVARRDVISLGLAQLACAVHWFNPLCWLALRQLRAEAERCCDDRVLSTGTRASSYAQYLLEMVGTAGRARVPSAALPMAQRSTFESRLLAILEPNVKRGAPGRVGAALTVGGLASLVVALGAMRPADAGAAGVRIPVPERPEIERAAPTAVPPAPVHGLMPEEGPGSSPLTPEAPAGPPAPVAVDTPPRGSKAPLETKQGWETPPAPSAAAVAGADNVLPTGTVEDLTWTASEDDTVRLQLSMRWGMAWAKSWSIARSELRGLSDQEIASPTSTPVSFRIEREAGVVEFEGVFTQGKGAGYFTFQPDRRFLQTLHSLGIQGADRVTERDLRLLALVALGHTSTTQIRELLALGLGSPSLKEVAELAINGVTPEYVRSLRSLGLSGTSTASSLVELRLHRITPQYVRDLEALGYRNVSRPQLLQMGIHGVTPAFIRKVREAGFQDPSPSTLVDMRIHGIRSERVDRGRRRGE
ncbi:MAG TPA: M56 family metallopeptidase [Longimicrobiaceae bacterium]|nr:M56 family metallopeptidase [Longimicrobiaceae bacterium]